MQNMQDTLHSYLYVSELPLSITPACIPTIIRQSRANNQRNNITGLLIFDGTHFCQYFEGSEVDVLDLADTILRDQRHCNINTCHSDVSESQVRRFDNWSMAYATINADLDAKITHLNGSQALQSFSEIIPTLDIA